MAGAVPADGPHWTVRAFLHGFYPQKHAANARANLLGAKRTIHVLSLPIASAIYHLGECSGEADPHQKSYLLGIPLIPRSRTSSWRGCPLQSITVAQS